MSVSIIAERFEAVCRTRADDVAVHTLSTGAVVTFGQMADEWRLIRRSLTDAGIGRGDVVVSVIGNSPLFLALLVACFEAGAVVVPVGEATDAETMTLIEQVGAAAVVVANRTLPLVVKKDVPLLGTARLLRRAAAVDGPRYGASALLKLTSGSTQAPRAAVASELHIVNDGRHVIDAMGIGPDDVNMSCIPLSHSYGIGNLVMPLLWQGTRIALSPSFNPMRFLRDVIDSGATVFPGVPFMFDRIRSLDDVDSLPPGLRLLITAGARIDADTVSWFRRRVDRKIHSFYGSSETGGISYDDSDDVADPLRLGHAMPETTVTIRAINGAGPVGRIFVEGSAVASGYADDAGNSDESSAFVSGGFLTGDLGYLDDDHHLILTGRVSPLVNVAGRKVDPAEVERRLVELPGVAEARVLGMSSDARGQEVVAFVVLSDPALTPISIRQRCAETLSPHKIPRRFVFLDSLPVDERGKIDRWTLQQLATEGGEE